MTPANEYTLVEKPLLDALTGRYGYRAIPPETHPTLRAMENEVLFRPLVVDALVRINGISAADAEAAFHEKLNEHGYIVPGLGDAGDRLYGVV